MDYSKYEEIEREILIKLINVLKPISYTFSPIGSKLIWDFKLVYGNGNKYLGEIKCLSCLSNTYDLMLLEEVKAKNLVFESHKLNLNTSPLYCMHYTDGFVRILKLSSSLLLKYSPQWINVNGKNKSVYLIPISESTILNITNDI